MSFLSSSQGEKFEGIVSEVDCGNQVCNSIFEVLETCRVYIEPEVPTSTCMIPCQVSGCVVKTYHFVNCAVWSCQDKVTTTEAPVTTSQPSPSPSNRCSGPVCATSVTVNVLGGTAGLVVLALWGRRAWQRRRGALYERLEPGRPEPAHLEPSAPPVESAASGADAGFQDVPLVPREDDPAGAQEHIKLKCFDSFKKFWSTQRQGQAETQF